MGYLETLRKQKQDRFVGFVTLGFIFLALLALSGWQLGIY